MNPFLETERLQLVIWYPEDYIALFEQGDKAHIMSVLGHETEAEYKRDLMRYTGGFKMYNRSFCQFQVVLKSENRCLGYLGYHNWFTDHFRAEIGYALKHDADKNKGYMKEALQVVIPFGHDTLKLHRIEAMVSPANTASLKLLEAHGFVREGLLKEHYLINGIFEDSLIFSLINHRQNT